jgi:hypothetical protein
MLYTNPEPSNPNPESATPTPQPALLNQVFTDPELPRNWKKYNLNEAKLVSIRTHTLSPKSSTLKPT